MTWVWWLPITKIVKSGASEKSFQCFSSMHFLTQLLSGLVSTLTKEIFTLSSRLPYRPRITMSKPTVLVTGCSQGGIGDALVRQFVNRGYHVFAALRNPSKAAHLRDEKDVEVVTLDVADSENISNLVAHLKTRLPEGKLDILVNNAGVGATGPLIEVDMEVAKKLYDVNVLGLLAVTQAFAPMLIAAKGKVVNISSVGGILALPWGGKSLLEKLSPEYLNIPTSLLIEKDFQRCTPRRDYSQYLHKHVQLKRTPY